jgi:hypothetical protein
MAKVIPSAHFEIIGSRRLGLDGCEFDVVLTSGKVALHELFQVEQRGSLWEWVEARRPVTAIARVVQPDHRLGHLSIGVGHLAAKGSGILPLAIALRDIRVNAARRTPNLIRQRITFLRRKTFGLMKNAHSHLVHKLKTPTRPSNKLVKRVGCCADILEQARPSWTSTKGPQA